VISGRVFFLQNLPIVQKGLPSGSHDALLLISTVATESQMGRIRTYRQRNPDSPFR
jgi:hypothetical protein